MFQLTARYLDGRSTRPHAVQVILTDTGVSIQNDAGLVIRSESWQHIDTAERTRHGPRRLTFEDDASLEFDDRPQLDHALNALGHQDSLVVGWQMSWQATLAAFAVLLVVLTAGYKWALPWAAQEVAERIPVKVEQDLGRYVYEQLDDRWFKPTRLPPERISQLEQRFEEALRAQPTRAPDIRIEFRSGGVLGPNALALPGGIVVVTDELVELAKEDDAILGVIAHELGHVHHRHVTASIVKASGLSMIALVLWGDASYLLAGAPVALMQASYSRDSETEADTYALAFIRHAGIQGERVADLLAALQKKVGMDGDSGLLDSHPGMTERIERFRRGE